jgi:hypothetical protein
MPATVAGYGLFFIFILIVLLCYQKPTSLFKAESTWSPVAPLDPLLIQIQPFVLHGGF